MSNHTKTSLIWEGPQLVNSSLGHVNRYLCTELLQYPDIDLKALPTEVDSIPDSWFEKSAQVKSLYRKSLATPQIHIRQMWPPTFQDIRAAKYVMFQPWEFGTIPKDWIERIHEYVDEIWVNSEYTRRGYLNSGIPSHKVFAFPLGFDPEIYHPHGPIRGLHTKKKVKFLFVGGTIYRKGIDLLLNAFTKTFSRDDDVCLVIKDHGNKSSYSGQTQEKLVSDIQKADFSPEILYMDNDFSPHELAALYRACDCLVHPYRGEGFGLPILEGMACGIPPIIPDQGPATEYTTEQTSFRVRSRIQTITNSELDTVMPVELLEVDVDHLSETMRMVYENVALAREKGDKATAYVHAKYKWADVSQNVHDRIVKLATSEVRMERHELGNVEVYRHIAHNFEGDKVTRKNLYTPLLRCFSDGDVVLDLGAGDGTWLELLVDHGVTGIGVETDPIKVEEMKRVGLTAVNADVRDYVSDLDFELDGLTMLHIIEHMSPQEAITLIRSVMRRFSYRGRILIVTPNCELPAVALKNFWLDITHVRPYPEELLRAMLVALGFRTIVSGKLNRDIDLVVFGSLLAGDNPFS